MCVTSQIRDRPVTAAPWLSHRDQECVDGDVSTSSTRDARVIRVVKILRILRIARVLKLVRFVT